MVDLTQITSGSCGTVVEIRGGIGAQRKIQALGIIEGKKIVIKSSQPFRGPITVEVDNMQIAVGHGMAQKIFVEVENK